jgi:hypothetical protein
MLKKIVDKLNVLGTPIITLGHWTIVSCTDTERKGRNLFWHSSTEASSTSAA